MVKPLIIKHADIWDGAKFVRRELYTSDRVLAQPANGAQGIDLDGYAIFSGLVNGHDHLELNHFPRTKFRDKYDNAHQWGEDVSKRLDDEPFKSLRALPLWDRLFIGGLKNLLCGATTVAHHNPPHKELFRADFPVRVLKRYGWAHSLHFSSDDEIVRAYRNTPPDVPFFIHLAEGTDEIASGEYQRLKALGCIGKNTVFVHGVGLQLEDVLDAHTNIYGLSHEHGFIRLVWCPSTNLYLLGDTLNRRILAIHAKTVLGSDSRLTADGDLLDEMRCAVQICNIHNPEHFVIDAVTEYAAKFYFSPEVGHLRVGAVADFIAFEPQGDASQHLCNMHRADLALVVCGGVPQIGAPDLMLQFPTESIPATLDGVPKRINIDLARQIMRCSIREPGLELDALPNERRKTFIGIRL